MKAGDTGKTRRTQVERSEEMRARLARAAYEVIAERGHSAFRTAAVADRAGVSQGAQTHHFPTKDALTLAAIDYAFATSSTRSEAIAARYNGRNDPIALMIEDFRQFFMGDEFWVALDITIDGSKDAELSRDVRPIVTQYRKPVNDRWIEILVQAGWNAKDATSIVRMTSALIGGFGMRTLWEDVDAYLNQFLVNWAQMIKEQFPQVSRPKRQRENRANSERG